MMDWVGKEAEDPAKRRAIAAQDFKQRLLKPFKAFNRQKGDFALGPTFSEGGACGDAFISADSLWCWE